MSRGRLSVGCGSTRAVARRRGVPRGIGRRRVGSWGEDDAATAGLGVDWPNCRALARQLQKANNGVLLQILSSSRAAADDGPPEKIEEEWEVVAVEALSASTVSSCNDPCLSSTWCRNTLESYDEIDMLHAHLRHHIGIHQLPFGGEKSLKSKGLLTLPLLLLQLPPVPLALALGPTAEPLLVNPRRLHEREYINPGCTVKLLSPHHPYPTSHHPLIRHVCCGKVSTGMFPRYTPSSSIGNRSLSSSITRNSPHFAPMRTQRPSAPKPPRRSRKRWS